MISLVPPPREKPTAPSALNYLCIDTGSDSDGSLLLLFTPHLMHWHGSVWVLDMTTTASYWQARAKSVRSATLLAAAADAMTDLFRTILQQLFPDHHYRACLAATPWHGLLAVYHMRERQLQGLLSLGEPMGQAFFQNISWDVFFGAAGHCGAHFAAPRSEGDNIVAHKGYNATRYARQQRQMLGAVTRLRVERPAQLNTATAAAISRRFGSTLAMLWDWTFVREETQAQVRAFPWRRWQPPHKPQITRHLDFPLWEWEHVCPHLSEDFDRLCALPTWSEHERVCRLSWTITLNDLSTIVIPVLFRYPHHLHKERGHHKTALLQGEFAFIQHLRRYVEEQDMNPAESVPLIGWQLIVEERMILPPALRHLFDDESDHLHSRIQELANKLPVSLQHYGLYDDWLPEASFGVHVAADLPQSHPVGAPSCTLPDPWVRAARERPLYLYATPQPLSRRHVEERMQVKTFIERVSAKWWLAADAAHTGQPCDYRDYYRAMDHEHRAHWIFHDGKGDWYHHGIFA